MDNNDNQNYWHLGDIKLRAANENDAELFCEHFNASPAWVERAFDRVRFPRSARESGRWLAETGAGPDRSENDDRQVFIIEKINECPFIGYVDVWEADPRNGVFKTGIKMAGGYAGKGYATRAFVRVLEYYFNELRYQKCSIYVYEFNEASLRFHKKLGFAGEGRLRREYYTEGRYYDSICLGLLAEELIIPRGI